MASTPTSAGSASGRPLPELEIIFYTPPPASSGVSTSMPQAGPRWQKLASRVTQIAGEQLNVQDLINHIPPCTPVETPLKFASRLADYVSQLQGDKGALEILLVSLCAVLSKSGRAAPTDIDKILERLVKSSKPRYLDRVKRGIKLANQIIGEWTAYQPATGDKLQELNRATKAILQCMFSANRASPNQYLPFTAGITLPQWGLLNSYNTKTKEYILSQALPETPTSTTADPPLLIPCLLQTITNQSLRWVSFFK